MRLFYNIGIRFYWLAAWIISPWNTKAKLWIQGRRGWMERLQQALNPKDPVIWFHCSSLGEFEQGRPVLEAFRTRFPEHLILLTFFSPSGYEKRKNYPGADHVMYLPLDTRRNARKLMDSISVEMALFIKYEFWHHFLNRLKSKEVPIFLVSGNFRPTQLFFKWYGGWYRKFLDCFTHIFVQKKDSEVLLRGIGFDRVTVAGDTRFDRVHELVKSEYRNETLARFTQGQDVVVAGSTWEKDEQILEYAFHKLPEKTRWIIAPHELSEANLRHLIRRFPSSVLFSQLGTEIPSQVRVVIVDTIGQLSYLYRFGTISYIGGGFGKGIHNTLEPATYGLPVLFGPAYDKFAEALDLIQLGGAFPVHDEESLLSTIREQLDDPDLLKTSSQIAGNYVQERVGATLIILDEVCKKLEGNMF
jgi:3-deoxy-D-manno-octulosonic-acid transferase